MRLWRMTFLFLQCKNQVHIVKVFQQGHAVTVAFNSLYFALLKTGQNRETKSIMTLLS
jgi:hypothetical protein